MAPAVAEDGNFQRIAWVAPWLHDLPMAEAIYGGADAVAGLLDAASQAQGAGDKVLVGASTSGTNGLMYQVPYYAEKDRSLIPA